MALIDASSVFFPLLIRSHITYYIGEQVNVDLKAGELIKGLKKLKSVHVFFTNASLVFSAY